jgi:hypothetical protein
MKMLCRSAAGVLLLLAAIPAAGTVRIENKAKELGFPAGGCAYCHTFDLAHMKEQKAKEAGVASTNCYPCHAKGLPKTGAALFNDRGNWLLTQKKSRQADAVDAAWLKDYLEPKKRPEDKR